MKKASAGDKTDMTNKDIMDKLDAFIIRYERDMRGDMNCGNGEKGLVGELREIKQYQKDFPTISHQFARHPVKVVGSVVGIYIVLMTLWTAGLLQVLAKTIIP
jgi:hypothetical protein